jgi:hypothetical protein
MGQSYDNFCDLEDALTEIRILKAQVRKLKAHNLRLKKILKEYNEVMNISLSSISLLSLLGSAAVGEGVCL